MADLRSTDLVGMRPGYLMHRFTQRLFGGEPPLVSAVTDGAEMGKLMVAEGLGITLLPDFSVAHDPLFRAGLITSRPLAGRRHQGLAGGAATGRRLVRRHPAPARRARRRLHRPWPRQRR